MSKFKAIIFDLDGTLLNTINDIADSVNNALKSRGLPIYAVEKYKYLVGDGMDMLAKRVMPEKFQDNDNINDFVKDIREEYSKLWNNKTTIYDGIPELLDNLVDRGIKISILSNKPDDFAKLTVSEYFKKWKFEIIQGAVNEIPKKPDPTQAVNIAKKLYVAAKDIAFIGDTSIDMKTAVAAGMYPIGVTWGFRTKDELFNNGARAIVNNPEEIIKVIAL